MTSCEDNDFVCQNPTYDDFDKIARKELSNPIDAAQLVNGSEYCMRLPIDRNFIVGDLDFRLYLKTLRGQSGLYHLWINLDSCTDHDTHTMVCVYVGKGPPKTRITAHINSKWPRGVDLYATFTQMDNRMAKYYEQLFLDCYKFELNTAENRGSEILYAVWDGERHLMGTHPNEVSALSKIQSEADWELD
jgi:hypothetical protein